MPYYGQKKCYFDKSSGIILEEARIFNVLNVFPDNSILLKGYGGFDDWCIYYGDNDEVDVSQLLTRGFVYVPDVSEKIVAGRTMKVKLQRPNERRLVVEGYDSCNKCRLFMVTPPRDVDYFSTLLEFSNRFGVEKVYNDFVEVFNRTASEPDPGVFKYIEQLAEAYEGDALQAYKTYSILYVAMIAEECRAGTKLGRRVKRLGVHQILFDGFDVVNAANFSKGSYPPDRALNRVKDYVLDDEPTLLEGLSDHEIDQFKKETRFWMVLDFVMKRKGF